MFHVISVGSDMKIRHGGGSRLYSAGRGVGFAPRHPTPREWSVQEAIQYPGYQEWGIWLLQDLVWAVQVFLKSSGVGCTRL